MQNLPVVRNKRIKLVGVLLFLQSCQQSSHKIAVVNLVLLKP